MFRVSALHSFREASKPAEKDKIGMYRLVDRIFEICNVFIPFSEFFILWISLKNKIGLVEPLL